MFTGVKTYTIPFGDGAALRTLQIMRQIVNESLIDKVVINTAKQIVQECWGKDEICQATTIREWVIEHLPFCRDPKGIELLHTPRYLIDKIEKFYTFQADCDDMAILSSSLAKGIGLSTRFVVLGFLEDHAPYTHVYTEILTKKGAVAVDLRDQYEVSGNISRKAIYEVK